MTKFSEGDLNNLAAIVHGGPIDEHRFNVSAVDDFLAAHPDMTPAEAVVELLTLIRGR